MYLLIVRVGKETVYVNEALVMLEFTHRYSEANNVKTSTGGVDEIKLGLYLQLWPLLLPVYNLKHSA